MASQVPTGSPAPPDKASGALTEEAAQPRQPKMAGVTARAMVIGVVVTALIDLWIHYAELVLGGVRGHTALANTSIPLGAFNVLFALVFINLILARLSPKLRLSAAELLTIYVMSAVSTVLSSSGGMHFLIPTMTAAHYFATAENGWAAQFFRYIPSWIAQSDPDALKHFYHGGVMVDLHQWAKQIAVWSGFLIIFTTATLSMVFILRKRIR